MAAASGPIESSLGKAVEMDEFKPPEPPAQRKANQSNTVDFKLPKAVPADTRKPESSTKDSDTDSTQSSDGTRSHSHSDRKDTSQSQSHSKKNICALSPAEQLKQTQVSIPYKEPIWGGTPPESEKYSFDVLKNGTVVENIELGKKPWLVFGRLPGCDVYMEHPSLSRHHAVVQYRESTEDGHDRGWYLYDLDSTHGTWVNKEKVKPMVYHHLRVGHVVKFGGSTRLYILQGPEEDQEPETELSVTELKQKTAKLKREAEVLKHAELNEEEERERQRQKILDMRGCSWGMGEDATEDTEENPFTVTNLVPQHEHLYSDDPKKALKGFYEREGCDLPDYQFTEVGFGKHKCVVDLPVDGPNGEILVAEATVSGKKKDAVIACALEACRLLDIHGMLHASKHESRKRKGKKWEDDDFYDSDEDEFLDRTGAIQKKRIYRMKKSGQDSNTETYESLLPKHEEVQKRISEIEHMLEQAKAQAEAAANEEEDALEAYMSAIKAGVMDTKTRLSLKREMLTLRTEEQRLRKLVNLAKPAQMPELKKLDSGMKKAAMAARVTADVRKIGIAKGPRKPLPPPVTEPAQIPEAEFQEEEEEDEEDAATPKLTEKAASASASSQQTRDTPSRLSPGPKAVASKPTTTSQTAVETNEGKNSVEKSSVMSSILAIASKVDQTATEEVKDSSVKSGSKEVKALQVKRLALSDAAGRSAESGVEIPSSGENSSPTKSTETSFEDKNPPPAKKKKRKVAAPRKVEYDSSDPDYAMWMPPKNQSGDGRTSLNDKLGY